MSPRSGQGNCGGTLVTAEHIWPDWLRRKVQVSTPFPHNLEEEADGIQVREISFEHPPFDQRVRAVCGTCNNGWMSDVEGLAARILEPLLTFSGARLGASDQRDLATWALMKAIVFDQLHPDRQIVLPAHRRALVARREPPPDGLWIWLAGYNAEQVGHYAYQGLKLAPPGR